jgi:hypothetical protein
MSATKGVSRLLARSQRPFYPNKVCLGKPFVAIGTRPLGRWGLQGAILGSTPCQVAPRSGAYRNIWSVRDYLNLLRSQPANCAQPKQNWVNRGKTGPLIGPQRRCRRRCIQHTSSGWDFDPTWHFRWIIPLPLSYLQAYPAGCPISLSGPG